MRISAYIFALFRIPMAIPSLNPTTRTLHAQPFCSANNTKLVQRQRTTTTKQQLGGIQCIWILLDCRATDWVTVHQFGVSVHQRFVRVEQQQCKTSWSVIECINSGWSTHSSILSPSSSSPSSSSSASRRSPSSSSSSLYQQLNLLAIFSRWLSDNWLWQRAKSQNACFNTGCF